MHRNFAGLRAETVTFSVEDDETFRCRSECPAGNLLDLAQALGGKVTVDEQALAFHTFMAAVILPEDWPKFEARLRDPERPISLPMMVEVATWLLETYTARPLEMRLPSEDGASNTGKNSTGGTRSKGSTRSTSTPVASATASL